MSARGAHNIAYTMATFYDPVLNRLDPDRTLAEGLTAQDMYLAAKEVCQIFTACSWDHAVTGGFALFMYGSERVPNNVNIKVRTSLKELWDELCKHPQFRIPKAIPDDTRAGSSRRLNIRTGRTLRVEYRLMPAQPTQPSGFLGRIRPRANSLSNKDAAVQVRQRRNSITRREQLREGKRVIFDLSVIYKDGDYRESPTELKHTLVDASGLPIAAMDEILQFKIQQLWYSATQTHPKRWEANAIYDVCFICDKHQKEKDLQMDFETMQAVRQKAIDTLFPIDALARATGLPHWAHICDQMPQDLKGYALAKEEVVRDVFVDNFDQYCPEKTKPKRKSILSFFKFRKI